MGRYAGGYQPVIEYIERCEQNAVHKLAFGFGFWYHLVLYILDQNGLYHRTQRELLVQRFVFEYEVLLGTDLSQGTVRAQ